MTRKQDALNAVTAAIKDESHCVDLYGSHLYGSQAQYTRSARKTTRDAIRNARLEGASAKEIDAAVERGEPA